MAIAPEPLDRGITQFNGGEFYACHDILEDLWMEAGEPDRTFLQGVLQVAVGLYHLTNHNWQGAVTLLGNGVNRLRPYGPTYAEVDVDHLLDWSTALLVQLQQGGPESIAASAPTTDEAEGAAALPYRIRYIS
ncbi:MAG: DUF309 domain-containing protein [Cyanobacteria bacterium P01_A01_bin.135]